MKRLDGIELIAGSGEGARCELRAEANYCESVLADARRKACEVRVACDQTKDIVPSGQGDG